MPDDVLAKLLEHNDWANREMIRACSALGDEQLDAVVRGSGHEWSVRRNLVHFVEAQQDYLRFLTRPEETVPDHSALSFEELAASAKASGAGLRAWADAENRPTAPIHDDGYRIAPWVVMVQALHHATEHRKQIGNLLRALGVAAPRLDGWAFGETEDALARLE